MEIELKLSDSEINLLLNLVIKLPYESANPLIEKIKNQANTFIETKLKQEKEDTEQRERDRIFKEEEELRRLEEERIMREALENQNNVLVDLVEETTDTETVIREEIPYQNEISKTLPVLPTKTYVEYRFALRQINENEVIDERNSYIGTIIKKTDWVNNSEDVE